MLGNMFELRKDWPIPPASTSNPPIKIEPQSQEAATPHAIITPKVEKCGWGPKCPICQNIGNKEEDWNGDKNQQNILCIPGQNLHPQPQSKTIQCLQNNPKTFDVPDRYSEQIRLCMEWDRKMERLELDSESDKGEDYKYKHKYKTLI